jgi:hypothetical protein
VFRSSTIPKEVVVMRTKLFIAVAALFLFALTFYVPREASAVPAFARQTGMACNSCHYQHFPTLNAFGRAFKAGGYTMVGGQSLIEGDFLSLPSTLNASLITKIRYQKTNGSDPAEPTNKGELQFPDEAALLIGGRAGEHVGFLLEASLKDGDSRFTSFKMPFVYNVGDETKVSVIPFSTDAAGAAYGFELLNTGAVRVNRPIEHRQQMSAQQFLATDGAATGVSFVVQRELYHANYTMWSNNHGNTDAGPYLHYARVAVTPTYAGWDLGAGVQWWGGSGKRGTATYEKADAWALDAQAQGTIGNFPVGIYASYGTAGKSDVGGTANVFNDSTTDDNSAFGALVEVGVIPNRLTLAAGFLSGDVANGQTIAGMNGNTTGGSQTAYTVGANFSLTQNVLLQWNSSFFTGNSFDNNATGDQLHTAQIFAAY